MSGEGTAAIAGTGGAGGAAAAGAAAAGTGATAAAGTTAYAWPTDLAADRVELLKAKGMYDDPGKGVPALVESYFNANKALSGAQDVIIVPGDGNLDSVYAKLGRPTTAAEYDFKFAPEVQTDTALVEFGKTFFHKLGVPAKGAQAAVDMWQKFIGERTAAFQADEVKKNSDGIAALKVKVGAEKFDAVITKGKAGFKALGLGADVIDAVERNIGGAALLQLMAALGEKLPSEAPVIGNGQGGGAPMPENMQTAAQVEEAMRAFDADKDMQDAYLKAEHPKHKEAVERRLALSERLVALRAVARRP